MVTCQLLVVNHFVKLKIDHNSYMTYCIVDRTVSILCSRGTDQSQVEKPNTKSNEKAELVVS